MCSASIAQVHKAKLPDGTLVAVKVQKPAIQHQFAFDLFLHKSTCLLLLPLYFRGSH